MWQGKTQVNEGITIPALGKDATSATVIGLKAGTAYSFKLIAKNGAELKSAAVSVSATTLKAPAVVSA